MNYHVAIIGAGAAGMMAAHIASSRGKKVCLIEKNSYPGKKILITGKGRCNVTNAAAIEDFIANTDLPNDFIQYDDLKMLGEFKSLIFLCPLGEYSSYLYSFIDSACGCEIALYVHGDKIHYSNSLQIERVLRK